MGFLDMTSRELEDAIDHLKRRIQTLDERIQERDLMLLSSVRETAHLRTAIRQLQAALNLPQLADDDWRPTSAMTPETTGGRNDR